MFKKILNSIAAGQETRKCLLNFFKAKLKVEFQKRNMADEVKKAKLIAVPTIGTHSGTFHCDEGLSIFIQKKKIFLWLILALACYMLKQLPEFCNHQILRSRDRPLLDECDIVVDVGDVFDPAKKRFDQSNLFQKNTNCNSIIH